MVFSLFRDLVYFTGTKLKSQFKYSNPDQDSNKNKHFLRIVKIATCWVVKIKDVSFVDSPFLQWR